MHRRVVIAAFGAAALAPVAWLVARPEAEPAAPLPSADERRAAELLFAVQELAIITGNDQLGPVVTAAREVHIRQSEALERVLGRASATPPPGPTPASSAVDVLRAERLLARKSLVSAVETSDTQYAQLFSAVHASASQIVAALRGARA